MMIKEGSTKIVNFVTLKASCAMAWPYKSYSENAGAWSYSENSIVHLLILSRLVHGSDKLSSK